MANNITPPENIISKIIIIKDQKVLLDSDIADLYGIKTKVLVQAVKRNIKRFPIDFMFQLSNNEFEILRSQIVTSKRGGRRYPPFVFTEQGIAMLSSVINSDKAIEVNILIMRAFVKLRELISSHKKVALKINEIESKIDKHDTEINNILELINELLIPLKKRKRKIGFIIDGE